MCVKLILYHFLPPNLYNFSTGHLFSGAYITSHCAAADVGLGVIVIHIHSDAWPTYAFHIKDTKFK